MSTPPDDHPERIEWMFDRGAMLDRLRHSDWIEDEMRYLWENPDEFEEGGTHDAPDNAFRTEYNLFRLGVLFGIEYEREYPTDERGD